MDRKLLEKVRVKEHEGGFPKRGDSTILLEYETKREYGYLISS